MLCLRRSSAVFWRLSFVAWAFQRFVHSQCFLVFPPIVFASSFNLPSFSHLCGFFRYVFPFVFWVPPVRFFGCSPRVALGVSPFL